MIDLAANDAAAINGVIDAMPKFTEPVTLADIEQYRAILRVRIAAQGIPGAMIEVFRHHPTEPVVVQVARVRVLLTPV